MADDTILCQRGKITVAVYRSMIQQKKKPEIAQFIHDRFTERYIAPLQPKMPKSLRNGFCTMAVSCLMIEALESFWQGLPNTKSKGASRGAFASFFDRSDNLKELRPYAGEFYTHVRCGILHQAETTGGWKIRRRGVLFHSNTLTLNAARFHDELGRCLDTYRSALEREPLDSPLWIAFKTKMKAICRNC
jgi:hypothetical protein